MLIVHRWTVVVTCAGLGICIALAGCRSDTPAEPNRAGVPKIPDTAPKKPPPVTPTTLEPIPSPSPPLDSPPVATTKSPAQPTSTATDKPAEPVTPPDAKLADAPDAPPFFPRGHREVPGWEKGGPIRTALPGKLDELVPEEAISIIKPYQIKRASTCVYRGTDKNKDLVANVLLIETHQPEDAYGIFSVLSEGPAMKVSSGVLMRSQPGEKGPTIHVWKGKQYLRIAGGSGNGPASLEACQALTRRMTFLMPDTALPPLVEAMPKKGLVAGEMWLVRDLASLSGPGVAGLKLPDAKQVSKLLELDRDSQMLIATYKVEGARLSHLVWVVRYDAPQQAVDAHKAYEAFLAEATDSASASTMLIKPRGRYLVGTWTAEEESLAPVMPGLLSNLE